MNENVEFTNQAVRDGDRVLVKDRKKRTGCGLTFLRSCRSGRAGSSDP